MSSAVRPLPRDPRPHRKIRASIRAGFVWAVAAAAINCLLWFFSVIAQVEFRVWTNGGIESGTYVTVGPIGIIGACLLSGLIAGLITGIAARYIKRVVPWIIVIGVILTLASLSAPLGQPESVLTSTRVILMIMHLVTGSMIIFGLVKSVTVDDTKVTA